MQSSVALAKRLVEPDYWTCPHGKVRERPVHTFGPAVADLCAAAGFAPDPQQELGLDLIFAIRPDGLPASFEICVICTRQNLKTGLFKQTAIGWLFVTEEPDVVWSSHEMGTTREAHLELANLIQDSPTLSRLLPTTPNRGVYDANGEERIELRTGQRILFRARRKTGGRGLAKRKLILDEAFALTPAMMGSIIPVMLAQSGPQVVSGSSSGAHDAEVLHDMKARGRTGSSPMMTYLEWGAPRDECAEQDCLHPKTGLVAGAPCALNRVELIEHANPALTTGRITLENIANTRQTLSAEEFMRECLGWWEEPDGPGLRLDFETWQLLRNRVAQVPSSVVAAVDVTPDLRTGVIAVAGRGTNGRTFVMVDVNPGTDWIVPKLTRLEGVLEVVVAPSTKAGALIPAMVSEGLTVHKLIVQACAAACGNFQNAVRDRAVEHLGQTELDAAVLAGRVVTRGELDQWERNEHTSPLIAASQAVHRWVALGEPDYDLMKSFG